MKSISSGLATHLQSELTTLAELIKITRTDGTIIAFTTHDADLTIDDVIYVADGSYKSSQLKQDSNLKANDYDVVGILASDLISFHDLEAGLYDYARIDISVCNWKDLSQGILRLRRGWFGEVSFVEGQYFVALRGIADLLSRRVGESYTPECRYDLGDSRCCVALASLSVTGSVTSVDSKRVFYDSSRMEDNGYFNDGKLTWLTGLNAGVSIDVNGWDLDSHCFTLWLSVPYEIQVGDTYSVTTGCDKRFATCRARFNNIVNYGGFPHLPGLGKLLLYPDNS
ncbi:MAG: DUF2163 domain-containing protein [Bdellovibrionales bacterium]